MIDSKELNKTQEIGVYIKDYITINIQSNKWPSGSKIPSERQLAIKFGTTSATVKKVISKFIENRIIESKYRRGYYVCEENILSPGDFLGLIPDSTLEIDFEELNQESFSEVDVEVFDQMINKNIRNSYKMFKKITRRDKEILKTTIIAIDKNKYELNKDLANDNSWFDKTFNVKIFNALIGNLIAKKIDIITSINSSENENYKGCTCFHSISLNRNSDVIEFAVTYVKSEYFVFKRIKEIK